MALPAQGLTWGTLMYHLPPPPPGRDCGLAAQASPAHRQGHACGLSNSSVTRSQNLSPGSWTARHSESGHPSGRTAARAQRSHERERERLVPAGRCVGRGAGARHADPPPLRSAGRRGPRGWGHTAQRPRNEDGPAAPPAGTRVGGASPAPQKPPGSGALTAQPSPHCRHRNFAGF